MEKSVQGNKERGGWKAVKEGKHDHTGDGNAEDMITAVWRLKMVNSEEKLEYYCIHHTVWIMPSRRQMTAWLWVWSSTTTIFTKTKA